MDELKIWPVISYIYQLGTYGTDFRFFDFFISTGRSDIIYIYHVTKTNDAISKIYIFSKIGLRYFKSLIDAIVDWLA